MPEGDREPAASPNSYGRARRELLNIFVRRIEVGCDIITANNDILAKLH